MKSLTNWEEFDALTDEQVIIAAESDFDAHQITEDEFKNFRRFPLGFPLVWKRNGKRERNGG